jgi:hypothetical protein
MKTKREMPLLEALDEIASEVQRLKDDGSARVNGQEIPMDEPVMLQIEKESGKKGAELEFDIKWPAKKGSSAALMATAPSSRRRLFRRRWLLLGLGAALAAGAVVVARRQRGMSDEDDEDELI